MRPSFLELSTLLALVYSATAQDPPKTNCDRNGFIASKSGQQIFLTNAWNATDPGSQCISVASDYKSFNATFWWPIGKTNTHSFPHVTFKSSLYPLLITDVSNLTLNGTWSMTPADPAQDLASTDVIANVAWDIFADANGTAAQIEVDAKYEIMFWLGGYGNPSRPAPLGYGKSCLTMTVSNIPFTLYCGTHPKRDQKVFSWLSETNVTDFNFDFNPLLQALPSNNLIPPNVLVGLVEFGAEAFYSTSNVTFSASNFGMTLQSKNGPPPKKSDGSRVGQNVQTLGLCLATLLTVGVGYLF